MTSKSAIDYQAAISRLACNISAYIQGNFHSYRDVSVQLRQLLCDSNALLTRLYPNARLHPLRGSQAMVDHHTVLYIPAVLHFDGRGGGTITHLLNLDAPTLSLPDWLSQKLFTEQITIREFIKSVADKEGAHSDEKYNDTLVLTKSVFLAGDDTLAAKTVIAIGEYMLQMAVRQYVLKNYDTVAAMAKQGYTAHGRGAVIIELAQLTGPFRGSLAAFYGSSEGLLKRFNMVHEDEKTGAISLLDNYDPTKEIVIWTINLTGSISYAKLN